MWVVGVMEIESIDMTPSDAVFSAGALVPRKEVPSLIPSSQSRPAYIFLPNWKRGQPAALDVTVISTLQRLTLQGAAIYHTGSCRGGGRGEEDGCPC